jgi:hypothetical protein
MAVIPHSPYSPDLAPCDFFLFPKMKLKLKGRRFDSIEENQATLQRVLDTLTDKEFQEGFGPGRRGWDRCFALPQLLYRWRHQSGIFWIPPSTLALDLSAGAYLSKFNDYMVPSDIK